MTLRLGDIAQDFVADSTEGRLNLYEWMDGSWAVLFSHSKDFTPVCTTELGYLAKLKSDFERRNVKIAGLSVDPVDRHRDWSKDIAETQGTAPNFPIIADPDHKVAELYGMVHPNEDRSFTVGTVFVIDPDKKIRLTITYPQTVGRNFDEILRAVDALQLTETFQVSTPVNWTKGEDVIIMPAVTNEAAKAIFPSGWKELKPYLRLTPDPSS